MPFVSVRIKNKNHTNNELKISLVTNSVKICLLTFKSKNVISIKNCEIKYGNINLVGKLYIFLARNSLLTVSSK